MKKIKQIIKDNNEDWRISKKSKWTSNFTPPTKTLSSNSSSNFVQVGDQPSCSSYTTSTNAGDFEFGTKDFTIDMWVKQKPIRKKWFSFSLTRNNECFTIYIDGKKYEPLNAFMTSRFLRRN